MSKTFEQAVESMLERYDTRWASVEAKFWERLHRDFTGAKSDAIAWLTDEVVEAEFKAGIADAMRQRLAKDPSLGLEKIARDTYDYVIGELLSEHWSQSSSGYGHRAVAFHQERAAKRVASDLAAIIQVYGGKS